jgi:hypothetical protein
MGADYFLQIAATEGHYSDVPELPSLEILETEKHIEYRKQQLLDAIKELEKQVLLCDEQLLSLACDT